MKRTYIFLCFLVIQLSSCRKWLDIKSNIADVTPTTLADYQAMGDYSGTVNSATPGLGMVSADNFYISYTNWQSKQATDRNAYIWASEVYEGSSPVDWSSPYKVVGISNIMLEGIAGIPATQANQSQWNNVKGSALFIRAMAFFNLSQLFAPPYNAATANTDLGIPLRVKADANERSVRANLQETYQKIIDDLTEAAELLPITPAYQSRPSKPAAYGLLAKVYLYMGNHSQSLAYADKSLTLYNTLIDFNTLNAAATFAFSTYPNNKEITYYQAANTSLMLANANPFVDSTLYQSYNNNDLRKTILYKLTNNLPQFRGSYIGVINSFFSGIATNEVYMIRAESNARLNNTTAAIADLNTVMLKRWKTGTFVPFTATTPADALMKILTERRKEFPFTGNLRWEDLRRLNTDPVFAKTLTRQLNGVIYTLLPNDKRYILPIPDDEIALSGIQQNPR